MKKSKILFLFSVLSIAGVLVFGSTSAMAAWTFGGDEHGDWSLTKYGTITNPVSTINRTYTGAPILTLGATTSAGTLEEGETAYIDLSKSVNYTTYTDTFLSGAFSITYYAYVNKYVYDDIDLYSMTYYFKQGGVTKKTLVKPINVELREDGRHDGDTVTITQTISMAELGLAPGTYVVDFAVSAQEDNKSGTLGTVVIPQPTIKSHIYPAKTESYAVEPINGYTSQIVGNQVQLKRTANDDSTDDIKTTLTVVSNGVTYTKDAIVKLNAIRNNTYSFVADGDKIEFPISEEEATKIAKTGDYVEIPSLIVKPEYEFVGWEPTIDGALIANGEDCTYTAVFKKVVTKDEITVLVDDVVYDGTQNLNDEQSHKLTASVYPENLTDILLVAKYQGGKMIELTSYNVTEDAINCELNDTFEENVSYKFMLLDGFDKCIPQAKCIEVK